MRVLYFSWSYTPHDHRFLTSMSASGLDVFFLQLSQNTKKLESRPLPDRVSEVFWPPALIPHTNFENPQILRYYAEPLKTIISQISPDIVHAGPVPTCGYVAALAETRNLLIMSWGSDVLVDAEKSPEWREATQYAIAHSSVLQCDCSAVRWKVQELCPFPDDWIVQFPWGIDVSLFSMEGPASGLRQKLGWTDKSIILCNRAWEPLYGIETVLRSFELLMGTKPEARLLLVGDGSYSDWVRRFIETNDMRDKVHCPGRIPYLDLPAVLRESDVYLSCSRSDGSSISLLEALSVGLPVVVSDIQGNREWVTSHCGSWLATPDHAEEFASGLVEAVDLNPVRRLEVARLHRQIALERADWEANFKTLLAMYGRLQLK